MSSLKTNDSDYKNWLSILKQQIRQSQLKATMRVNQELLKLYWNIGADITAKRLEAKYGAGIITQLSMDLRAEFPDMQGFSTTNLKYMKMWYLFYSQKLENQPQAVDDFVPLQNNSKKSPQAVDFFNPPQLITEIPWGHNREIITKCKSVEEALFYVEKTIEEGWSRSTLLQFMESDLYKSQGRAITNFTNTLPALQSELVKETLKDPYNFDFLCLTTGYKEKELEDALEHNITKFLLELGSGFAFMGKQVEIIVSDRSFFIDMLFYHVKLRCYVVVELKTVRFEPEFAGKLNFYVAAVDRQLRNKNDNATVGLLICKDKDDIIAEYSLSDIHKPVGISSYELKKILPKELQSALPSIKEMEEELTERLKKKGGEDE